MKATRNQSARCMNSESHCNSRKLQSEETRLWVEPTTQLRLCDASFTTHHFPKHSHDYYVIGLITDGVQRFSHRGREYQTPPGGMILLNPDDDHTGESVSEGGFRWRAVYPTSQLMDEIAQQLCRKFTTIRFARVRIDDDRLTRLFIQLHESARTSGVPDGMREELLGQLLVALVEQATGNRTIIDNVQIERKYVLRACDFLRAQLSLNHSLTELADNVGIDAFRLIRAFNHCLGMPPFRYLESLRIREAQRLLENEHSLVDIACELGFTDQSYFNRRFKRQMGVSPGQYRQMLASERG